MIITLKESRFAKDSQNNIYKEESLYIDAGTCGNQIDDERNVEIDGKLYFKLIVKGSLADPDSHKDGDSYKKSWYGRQSEMKMTKGMKEISEAEYIKLLDEVKTKAKGLGIAKSIELTKSNVQ